MKPSPDAEAALHLVLGLADSLALKGVVSRDEFIAMIRTTGAAASAKGKTEMAALLRDVADMYQATPFGE